jgi:threonine dehydratase
VLGVEAEASSPFTQSLAAGRIVEVDVQPTLADGLAGNLDPDTITFGIVQQLVSRILRVSEDEITAAIRGVIIREKLVAEGAGAAGVAALLAGKVDARSHCIAVVLSGGNIDADVLRTLI